MEITQGSQGSYKSVGLKHRGGGLEFKYLSLGKEGTLENYGLTLAKQRDFSSPVHRHNFDQFRFAVNGSVDLGPGMILHEGWLSYHPEGAYYGPQADDGSEERLVLVLQCGGASRQGYLSFGQLEAANKQLSSTGKFEGGKYHADDGTVTDGYQALWEHVNKRKLQYPKPRYQHPILIDPAAFEWVPEATAKISRKAFGVFSERLLKAEQILIEEGTLTIGGDKAIHLLYALEGSGLVGSEKLMKESTISLQPGTSAQIAGSHLLLLHYQLPLLD